MIEDHSPCKTFVEAVRHYLQRCGDLLTRVVHQPNTGQLLAVKLVPDAFDKGFHLAAAIQFAARTLCLPSRLAAPEIEEPDSLLSLQTLYEDLRNAIAAAPPIDWKRKFIHVA